MWLRADFCYSCFVVQSRLTFPKIRTIILQFPFLVLLQLPLLFVYRFCVFVIPLQLIYLLKRTDCWRDREREKKIMSKGICGNIVCVMLYIRSNGKYSIQCFRICDSLKMMNTLLCVLFPCVCDSVQRHQRLHTTHNRTIIFSKKKKFNESHAKQKKNV